MDEYVTKQQKRLRRGYTTGSCAAAAAAAAARDLLLGEHPEVISLRLPGGETITLPVFRAQTGTSSECAEYFAVKDGGDDPDVTTGAEIHVRVERISVFPVPVTAFHTETYPALYLTGGEGVGVVTKPGLEQRVGQSAINRVPREMIFENVAAVRERAGDDGCLLIRVSVPTGAEVATHTFNPVLGIEGGISILGTSGIVDPMSEQAIVDTIEVQIRQRYETGARDLLVVPGHYGMRYAGEALGLAAEEAVECSNFIGETLDLAVSCGMESFLLVGNLGKLIKLAAGIMNTHSRMADGRAEIMIAQAALCGGSGTEDGAAAFTMTPDKAASLMDCITTEEMLVHLDAWGIREAVLQGILRRIETYVGRRLAGKLRFGVVIFSEKYGYLGETSGAEELLRKWRPAGA